MLELSKQIIYNKIEQCLVGILRDFHYWEACEIKKCKDVE